MVCWVVWAGLMGGPVVLPAAIPPASVDGTMGSASAIAAGSDHSCAIQSGTGAVVCWGSDSFGQASPPASVDGTTGSAIAIAAGSFHSCAIQSGTGAVVCWGSDSFGQASPPASVDGTTGSAIAIAAGSFHSCAIQSVTGAVVCWGDDSIDCFENPDVPERAGSCASLWNGRASPPASVDGTTGSASAIAAGSRSSRAIAVPEPGAAGLALLALVTLATLRLRSKRPRKGPESTRLSLTRTRTSDLVSLARSLAEDLMGQQEFGTELEEAAQVCLEDLAKAVEAERFGCQRVAESFDSSDGREIAAELRARAEAELDVPEL